MQRATEIVCKRAPGFFITVKEAFNIFPNYFAHHLRVFSRKITKAFMNTL